MSETSRRDAFLLLYDRHESRLHGLAFSLLQRWNDVEDVLQEANLVMWTKFEQFRPGTNFFAWAARILQLKVKEFRRRSARNEVALSLVADSVMETTVHDSRGMTFELAERFSVLNECLAELTSDQRNLLNLRYSARGDINAMAIALGRTPDAVYKSISRIRQSLIASVDRKLHRRLLNDDLD